MEINDHGTRYCYQDGCRCDACREAQSQYHRDYLERKENAATRPYVVYTPSSQPEAPSEAGPVELAVLAELDGLSQKSPTLVAISASMAKILDDPRPRSNKPSAAKVLVSVLDAPHKSTPDRRGNLALVKGMTKRGGA